MTTSWGRSRGGRFIIGRWMWVRTVFVLRKRLAAMSSLLWPWAARAMLSCSLAVRLARMSPCSGWFAAVVAAGVAEIAMIDQEPVAGTETGQAHAAAGERRQARGAQEPEPRRGVLAIAADRVDVQVEPRRPATRGSLPTADHP